MCAGAILNARLKWVCYGARDEKTGSCGSVLNLFEENYGYRPALYGGVLEEDCLARLRDFFRDLRRQ
jgi:tRNA(adenine34) deaminase